MEFFEVEAILDKRENPLKYLVKWKNYPSDANSWEPPSSFNACSHLIDKYEALKVHSKRTVAIWLHVQRARLAWFSQSSTCFDSDMRICIEQILNVCAVQSVATRVRLTGSTQCCSCTSVTRSP